MELLRIEGHHRTYKGNHNGDYFCVFVYNEAEEMVLELKVSGSAAAMIGNEEIYDWLWETAMNYLFHGKN